MKKKRSSGIVRADLWKRAWEPWWIMDYQWQWYPGVYWEECGHQVEGGDPPPPFGLSEATSAVLCSVLASSVQERE